MRQIIIHLIVKYLVFKLSNTIYLFLQLLKKKSEQYEKKNVNKKQIAKI